MDLKPSLFSLFYVRDGVAVLLIERTMASFISCLYCVMDYDVTRLIEENKRLHDTFKQWCMIRGFLDKKRDEPTEMTKGYDVRRERGTV